MLLNGLVRGSGAFWDKAADALACGQTGECLRYGPGAKLRRGSVKPDISKTLRNTVILALALSLTGCFGTDIPDAKRTTGRNPEVAEVPSKDETVRGEEDPP